MGEVIFIEICTSEEIRFLRRGDLQYTIEGEKQVSKFMRNMDDYSLFSEQEEFDLREYGLEFFHNEHDFKDILNLLDRVDIDVLKKHSNLIN